MAHAYDRRLRVADLIKHELGRLLLSESRDPRFTFVSITSVDVARDYANAKVFVTLLDDSQVQETLEALNRAAGFFRYELANKVNLRTTPRLHFYYDESLRQGQRINDLLKKRDADEEE